MTLNIPLAFPLLRPGETLHASDDQGWRSGVLLDHGDRLKGDRITDGTSRWNARGYPWPQHDRVARSLVIMCDDQEVASVEWKDGKPVRVEREDVAALRVGIGSLRREINTIQGSLAVAKKERDTAIAERTARAKLLMKARSDLAVVCDGIEDEGDRAFFGSTNDADLLRDLFQKMDAWNWSDIMRDKEKVDPFETSRNAVARAEAAETDLATLRARCERMEEALKEIQSGDSYVRRESFVPAGSQIEITHYGEFGEIARAALKEMNNG